MAENRNETPAQRREREDRERAQQQRQSQGNEGDRPTADEMRARREEAEGAHLHEPEEMAEASRRADEAAREAGMHDQRSDEQRRGVPPNPQGRDLGKEAMERELALSRTQGIIPDYEETPTVGPTGLPVLWVMSNRRDNRVVAWWRDQAQPGGEAFIGPAPEFVARTPEVERLLMSGEAIEVPEPMKYLPHPEKAGEFVRDDRGLPVRNPAYPAPKTGSADPEFAAQPGRPIPLGREPSPQHFTADQIREIRQRQARIPAELPAPIGGIVPGVTHQVA